MAYQYIEWPKWMFGPNDESKMFQTPVDVPEGWVDHPSKVGQHTPENDAGGEGQSEDWRELKGFPRLNALKSILKDAGVEFDAKAKTSDLETLVEALEQQGGE